MGISTYSFFASLPSPKVFANEFIIIIYKDLVVYLSNQELDPLLKILVDFKQLLSCPKFKLILECMIMEYKPEKSIVISLNLIV